LITTTPQKIWLSTGIPSVDHCVETLCSLQSNDGGDAWAARGLQKLISGPLRCKHDPNDLDARYLCQVGVVKAMRAVSSGVPLGASHAIGRQLGPLNVGHGDTSCILLPEVCKFNALKNANNDREKRVVEILLKQDTVKPLLANKKVSETDVDLGDILDLIIRELEMSVLRLAANSLNDIWIKTNAYPITKEEEVLEILEAVAGN
jgi:alcohol dehydrogenase class IV